MLTCHVCKKVEENGTTSYDRKIFSCDHCKLNICIQCANISSTEQRCLVRSKRSLIFYCPQCLKNAELYPEMAQKYNTIQATNETLLEEQAKIQENIIEIANQLDKTKQLNTEVNNIKDKITNLATLNDENRVKIKELHDKQNNLNQNFEEIKNNISTEPVREIQEAKKTYSQIVKSQTELIKRIEEVEKNPAHVLNIKPEPLVKEMEDRQLRQSNVLFFGFPESKTNDWQKRKDEDTNLINNYIKNLTKSEQKYEFKAIRLGKYNPEKTRPIKAIFNDKQDAQKILKQKNNIPEEQKMYIKYDQTEMQRNYLQQVLMEFNNRINHEKDIKIKYVNNVPTIIKITDKRNTNNFRGPTGQ